MSKSSSSPNHSSNNSCPEIVNENSSNSSALNSTPGCSQRDNVHDNSGKSFEFSNNLSLERIRQLHAEFVSARNWDQYHLPRNLLLALVGEVGEVSELFQWRSDAECQLGLPDWTDDQRVALGEELSDVLIYLIRLAARCHIDLPQAVLQKMEKNSVKYPIDKAFGSAKKYTEL